MLREDRRHQGRMVLEVVVGIGEGAEDIEEGMQGEEVETLGLQHRQSESGGEASGHLLGVMEAEVEGMGGVAGAGLTKVRSFSESMSPRMIS